ncbi:uncharacterized protein LOC107759581, partial [Nicotiana tabacum]|uniref:Uncharacterized protein LOC107759581 n=1 Tax=Nicotiana tabacum TaxID=4097 RepID=A0A1S3WZ95_TOBAC
INGRPVLQPNSNIVPFFERRNSLKKSHPTITFVVVLQLTTSAPPTSNCSTKVKILVTTPPISPKMKSPRQPVIKRGNIDHNGLTSSAENVLSPKVEALGSITVARREQVATAQVQRKIKIAHYGRTKSAKYVGKISYFNSSSLSAANSNPREGKRCSFITPNSVNLNSYSFPK